MNRICLLLISILIGQITEAHVDKSYFLIAKLKTSTVVLKMWSYDEVSSKYGMFYDSNNLQSRYLKGQMDDSKTFLLAEFSPRPELLSVTNPDTFRLSETTQKEWLGTWTHLGQTQSVKFEPLTIDTANHPYAYHKSISYLNPFAWKRVSYFKFKKTETQPLTKDYSLVWMNEINSGNLFFRLKAKRSINTDSINRQLELIHLQAVDHKFSFSPRFKDTPYFIKTSTVKIDNGVLSFDVEESRMVYSNTDPATVTHHFKLYLSSGRPVPTE